MISDVIEERPTELPCDLDPFDDRSPILALTPAPPAELTSIDVQGRGDGARPGWIAHDAERRNC